MSHTQTIAQKLGYPTPSLDYDFAAYRQRHDSYFASKEQEMEIRYKNLQDVVIALRSVGVKHWLQGKTMLGIAKYGSLLENDSDEDIGTDSSNIDIVCNEVIPILMEQGFEVIRATANGSMVTVMRNHRYIDICFFRNRFPDQYYYEQKSFPHIFYYDITNVVVNGFSYSVPERYNEICRYSYNL